MYLNQDTVASLKFCTITATDYLAEIRRLRPLKNSSPEETIRLAELESKFYSTLLKLLYTVAGFVLKDEKPTPIIFLNIQKE